MIEISNLNKSEPYDEFHKLYISAVEAGQDSVEAIAISSFNKNENEVESRFVNLKYIKDDEWIFFTNYSSKKAKDFLSHDQISALFHWPSTNVQIRIKARIRKSNSDLSDDHFKKRTVKKNALAISSNQSNPINSYDDIIKNYNRALNSENILDKRPEYWGGYSFTPYYFEFWEGHESRINKRTAFKRFNGDWKQYILEP